MDEIVKIVKIVKIGSSVKIPGQKIYTVEAAGYHAPFLVHDVSNNTTYNTCNLP